MIFLSKENKDFELWLSAARNDGAFLLADKAQGWTSFDVVAKLRGMLKIKKIGHAGTLDPMATGLLVVACGKATKEIDKFQALPKEYKGSIKIGAITKTDDAESPEENIQDAAHIKIEDILSAKENLTGKILQKPPMYSAKHINGKRAYELARKEVEFELPANEVEVFEFEIRDFSSPYISFRISCSKGTYIRSIARDMGALLGCGAYLSSLRRSAIGSFRAENALTIDEIQELSLAHKKNADIQ